MVAEAMWFGCGGYVDRLRRLCASVAEAMWWGKIENKAKLSPSKAGARTELGNKMFYLKIYQISPKCQNIYSMRI